MKKLIVLALILAGGCRTEIKQVRAQSAVAFEPIAVRVVDVEIISATTTTPTLTCPTGMILVEGDFCPNVDQRCLRWVNDYANPSQQELRCLEFAPSRCLSTSRTHMRFCMDQYEAPNVSGANPVAMISWFDARRSCESQGRRLCNSNEWTFACEGEAILPYPYGDGLHRDSSACRIDHVTVTYNPARLANPATSADEARRSYEAVPSGFMNRCVSWAGIHDMTGNVDEWVENANSSNMLRAPFHSGLKGGWWGPVRTRCRPMTTVHSPSFVYYQIGYRCCANAT